MGQCEEYRKLMEAVKVALGTAATQRAHNRQFGFTGKLAERCEDELDRGVQAAKDALNMHAQACTLCRQPSTR